uniref:Uncharacterized protein n=1 Tax=viral metagenome TaxID=1070528 RepID=A0A6C0IRB1_9ZZZZ
MENTKPENVASKLCKICIIYKDIERFHKNTLTCKDCHNLKRREKYNNNEEHRKKLIEIASIFKHNKVIIRQQIKQEEQEKIGIENKICKYCEEIKPKTRFRHNRLKCKDCERDDPNEKFKRYVRTRIYNCLRYKNKSKHSIEYLGCTSQEYFNWMLTYDPIYNLDNYGPEWHIDHVIPLSTFNLENLEEQLIAFNWRNTMPLSAKSNMSKNNRINKAQVITHFTKLTQYHNENNIELPQKIIDLFAT